MQHVQVLLTLCISMNINGNILQRSRRQPVCGDQDYLTASHAEIISHTGYNVGHNYGKNQDCVWKIEAPDGLMVALFAVSFEMEIDYICRYDYLELFDGPDLTADSLGRYCGNKFYPISSTQRFLTLQFVTDNTDQHSGFKLFYNFTNKVIESCLTSQFQCANGMCIDRGYYCDSEDDCGDDSDEQNCKRLAGVASCGIEQFKCPKSRVCIAKAWLCDGDDDCGDRSDESPANCNATINTDNCGESNITGISGTIMSPNYPLNYPRNTRCIYTIQAAEGTKSISFKFDEDFDVERSIGCRYDFVNIAGAVESELDRFGPFCGNDTIGELVVDGDHASVVFKSDPTDEFGGFLLNWQANERSRHCMRPAYINDTMCT